MCDTWVFSKLLVINFSVSAGCTHLPSTTTTALAHHQGSEVARRREGEQDAPPLLTCTTPWITLWTEPSGQPDT